MYCVYKHTCPNGKVYIGITKQIPEKRWKNGLGYQSSPHFWNAIVKYGWGNIKHEILHDHLTKDEACDYERQYIEEYDSTNRRCGYNEKTGGEIGVVFNDYVKQKMSASIKKSFENNDQRRKTLSEKAKKQRWSEESRKKLSIAKTGLHVPHTKEWNNHISEANKIRFNKGVLHDKSAEQCRTNGYKAALSVEQLDLDGNVIAVYSSMKEAGRATGVRDGCISLVCRDQRKTAGGYRWRYAI